MMEMAESTRNSISSSDNQQINTRSDSFCNVKWPTTTGKCSCSSFQTTMH